METYTNTNDTTSSPRTTNTSVPNRTSSTSSNGAQEQWVTVSSPNASVIVQERKIPDALQKAIQESLDMGKAHRAG